MTNCPRTAYLGVTDTPFTQSSKHRTIIYVSWTSQLVELALSCKRGIRLPDFCVQTCRNTHLLVGVSTGLHAKVRKPYTPFTR